MTKYIETAARAMRSLRGELQLRRLSHTLLAGIRRDA